PAMAATSAQMPKRPATAMKTKPTFRAGVRRGGTLARPCMRACAMSGSIDAMALIPAQQDAGQQAGGEGDQHGAVRVLADLRGHRLHGVFALVAQGFKAFAHMGAGVAELRLAVLFEMLCECDHIVAQGIDVMADVFQLAVI